MQKNRHRAMRRTAISALMALIMLLTSSALADQAALLYEDEGYRVEYESAELLTNAQGENVLAVYFNFTNESVTAQTFVYSFGVNAFQDGIECDQAYSWDFADAPDEAYNALTSIKNGASVRLARLFTLKEADVQVDVEFSRLFSLTSAPTTLTFSMPEAKLMSLEQADDNERSIIVDFSEEELAAITAEALTSGQTPSQWIRERVLEALN